MLRITFQPDLPLSMEQELSLKTVCIARIETFWNRKSVLTNLTDNKRRSNSVLPRVHSDWPHMTLLVRMATFMSLHYLTQVIYCGLYGRAHAGLLEPFFAGIGGEILYKPAQSILHSVLICTLSKVEITI